MAKSALGAGPKKWLYFQIFVKLTCCLGLDGNEAHSADSGVLWIVEGGVISDDSGG